MDIYINQRLFYGPLVPSSYGYTTCIYSVTPLTGEGMNVILIKKTNNSTLPPILNALEIYRLKEFPQLLTDQQDVDVIMNIKSKYGVNRSDWQGDPCAPADYLWQGLNCSYDDSNPPRIISINLSSSGIAGEIPLDISKLTSIRTL
ncbi:LRR receptor-like serine/threonine-protein kinase IOS1 [Pistacia vera]|uniref:LRR receptor-like serine/threonine-protein kinase IOS1 n=1 Tax=Pistacia vera TaxID=55513 RepID=UPI001262F5AD|nr:LRR receptor-like serine/threonine-protein kinase IOS1 [Pistacia vera]